MSIFFAPVFGLLVWMFGEQAPESSIAQRIYAAAASFFASYTPLGGVDEPSSGMSVLSTIAMLVVVGAIALTAFDRLRRWARSYVVRPDVVVVVGSGVQARLLIESCLARKVKAVLVAESFDSPAARAADRLLVLAATPSVEVLPRPVRRVMKKAQVVILATDSDAVNVATRDQLRRNGRLGKLSNLVAVVRSARLSDALREATVPARLPIEDVACPDENLAEQVCQVLVGHASGDAVSTETLRIRVLALTDEAAVRSAASTLRLWLTRLQHSWSFLHGKRESDGTCRTLPRFAVDDEPSANDEDEVLVVLGDESEVASWVLTEGCAGRPLTEGRIARPLTIALTKPELVGLHDGAASDRGLVDSRRWLATLDPLARGTVVVIDPDDARYDVELMAEDLSTMWARAFHQAYNVMYGAASPWKPQLPSGREEQSSNAAVHNMTAFLAEHGYVMVRVPGVPAGPEFPDDVIDKIAGKEHEDWRVRKYKDRDNRGKKELVSAKSSSGLGPYSWEDLRSPPTDDLPMPKAKRDEAIDYNRRVVTEVYPALAALFGYEIRRREDVDGLEGSAEVGAAAGVGEADPVGQASR